MKAFTDYPILELGDKSGEEAPVRVCEVIKYDQDKYCEVLVDGVTTEIKSGYIYSQKGRCGEVPVIDLNLLRRQGKMIHNYSKDQP